MKLQLHIQSLLQGNFAPKELNLAFVFQVNCPGCFIYGFPTVNELYENFQNTVGFIGISTCFEDFDKNTEVNTRKLLQTGELTGETQKYFSQHNVNTYPFKISFPIAFDQTSGVDEFLTRDNMQVMCRINPDFSGWPDTQKREMEIRISAYYAQFSIIAHTFTLNQLNGTPSFIIFDKDYHIKKSFFGHIDKDTLAKYLA